MKSTQPTLDYKLFAGVLIGIIFTIPLTLVASYYIFLAISARVRAIVNEYGR
ncbi:putative movement protein [Miscanthus yellow fleck virus]|uniref:Movement protein n=1 Tax=Miscanthus yellow fleck virus TaxID=2777538 RepID=A0A7L8YSP6_9VIRU|nr:putative movement protein [Miscanthus yellow fleck virus]